MSTYYVDFSGWCKVEADSANEAEAKFWEYIYDNAPLRESRKQPIKRGLRSSFFVALSAAMAGPGKPFTH